MGGKSTEMHMTQQNSKLAKIIKGLLYGFLAVPVKKQTPNSHNILSTFFKVKLYNYVLKEGIFMWNRKS